MFFSTLCAPLFALGAYTVGVLAIPAVSDMARPRPLPAAYGSTRSGPGGYPIESSNFFTHADTSDTPKDFYPNAGDIANTKLSRDLAASNPLHEPVFLSCTPVQKRSLVRAVGSFRKYVTTTIDYLQTRGPKPAYKRCFGAHNTARMPTVKKVFRNIGRNDLSDFTFACDCTDDPFPVFRIDHDHPKILHLCTDFWRFPADDVDESQAIILIVVAASLEEDVPLDILAVGRDASLELARNNPAAAVLNIHNYLELITTVVGLTVTAENSR